MLYGTTLAISDEAWPWVMAVLGIATIFYAVFRPMLRRKRDALDRPANFRPSQQRAVENEMQNLLVELSKMAQQVSAQLDTRAAKLEMLIDDADQKIAELQALASRPAAVPTPAPLPAPPAPDPEPPAAPTNGDVLDARYARIYALADGGQNARQIATELDRPHGEVELILALRRRE
jgi:hypothetical protein